MVNYIVILVLTANVYIDDIINTGTVHDLPPLDPNEDVPSATVLLQPHAHPAGSIQHTTAGSTAGLRRARVHTQMALIVAVNAAFIGCFVQVEVDSRAHVVQAAVEHQLQLI